MELMELEGEESVEREQLQEPPGGPEPTELEEPTEETENELKDRGRCFQWIGWCDGRIAGGAYREGAL